MSVGMGIGWFGAMLPRRGRLRLYDNLLTRVSRYVVWRHLVDVAFLFVLRVGSCNTGCQSRCASCGDLMFPVVLCERHLVEGCFLSVTRVDCG